MCLTTRDRAGTHRSSGVHFRRSLRLPGHMPSSRAPAATPGSSYAGRRLCCVTADTALHTDHYELTMLSAALRDGTADRRCVFEVFARRLPVGRRYGVVAGTGRLLEHLADVRFTEPEVAFLLSGGVVDDRTANWLAGYRVRGDL